MFWKKFKTSFRENKNWFFLENRKTRFWIFVVGYPHDIDEAFAILRPSVPISGILPIQIDSIQFVQIHIFYQTSNEQGSIGHVSRHVGETPRALQWTTDGHQNLHGGVILPQNNRFSDKVKLTD